MYRNVIGERLVLASASPRRKDLLAACGLKFEILPSNVDESLVVGETPKDTVIRLAGEKAEAAPVNQQNAWVLGADTIVVLGESEILGKPVDESEAIQMLEKLQGRVHEVHGAFALINKSKNVRSVRHSITKVRFAAISRFQIENYVGTGEPMDKAGAYAAQGLGAAFIASVEGSYTNVIGLALAEVIELLLASGVIE